jgi:hypothetical protein
MVEACRLVTRERIERRIWVIRGHKVMLDSDLAELYGVETKALNQAVKRNLSRFPADFMFQLTGDEADFLKSQFVTSNGEPAAQPSTRLGRRPGRGGRRTLPKAFTEQGVAMLSSVLRSPQAAVVNIEIMRASVRLREGRLGPGDPTREAGFRDSGGFRGHQIPDSGFRGHHTYF